MTVAILKFALLALACFGALGAVSHGTLTVTVAKPDTLQSKISHKLEDLKHASSRLPKALVKTVGESAKTFVTSSSFLIPLNLAMTLDKVRPLDQWLLTGVYRGTSWAKTSAMFVGAEAFFETMRNKKDRLNRQLASGVSSSLMKISEGPVGMTQGFCFGFGIMVALDRLMPDKSKPSVPTSSWMRRNIKASDEEASTVKPAATSSPVRTSAATATTNTKPTPAAASKGMSSSAEIQPRDSGIGSILRSFKLGK